MEDNLFEKHLKLVMEANKTTNITRIESYEEGRLLHIEDSLLGLQEINNAPIGKYADLGSGAGFPGIPLAIKTGRESVLIDTVGKKVSILNDIISKLGLSNVSAVKSRIEEYALDHPLEFSVVTARALAKLSVLMELASPLLKEGGYLICYKALVSSDEYSHAINVCQKLGFTLESDRTIELQEYTRRLIVFKKTGTATIKLPRKNGFAQKRPL